MEGRDITPPPDVEAARNSLNFRRGMIFLRFALEQVRCSNPTLAEYLQNQFVEPLRKAFEQIIARLDYQEMDRSSQMHHLSQQWHGEEAWRTLTNSGELPMAPPGFGLRQLGLMEANNNPPTTAIGGERTISQGENIEPVNKYQSPWASQLQLNLMNMNKSSAALTLPKTSNSAMGGMAISGDIVGGFHHRRDHGPIGQPKRPSPSTAYTTKSSTLPSSSVSPNSPFDQTQKYSSIRQSSCSSNQQSFRASSNEIQHGLDATPEKTSTYETDDETAHRLDAESLKCLETAVQSQQSSKIDEVLNNLTNSTLGSNNQESKSNNQSSTAASSWAKIAAIPGLESGQNRQHVKIKLASPVSRMAVPVATAAATSATPRIEPTSSQMRVVWLANLPPCFGLRDVSAKITEGPVMSILLQRDAHASLPGLSACIIFMNAEDATRYLTNNNYSISAGKITGPTKYAHFFRHDQSSTAISLENSKSTDTHSEVKDIFIIRGSPYPIDGDNSLQSMWPPTNARRRLKWSRSRLFYDVSIRQFKRDVLSLVGGKRNVELFHFYNPGECTVVFSSVGVAAECLAGFDSLRRGRGRRREVEAAVPAGNDDVSTASAGEVTTLEEEGRSGGVHHGRLDGKRGRYEGVDVGYVRDFNEAKPESLWSQYGRDGKLRATSRMEGCEGLFEGPTI